jgi:hypothetical protein
MLEKFQHQTRNSNKPGSRQHNNSNIFILATMFGEKSRHGSTLNTIQSHAVALQSTLL